jgi:peptide/nickel transport system substrate-binding protein
VKWKRDVTGIRPNIIESWEWNEDATELMAYFRQGIKWSDGEPFTVDDFVFFWDDMVLDEDVPVVTPAYARAGGEAMGVEKVDDYTLKFTFAAAHPLFLDMSARGNYNSALNMVPAHYLKQFHPKYSDAADTTELMARYDNRQHYPDMPTLDAWKVTAFSSGESATFERNPYYWKVDPEGNQLPYIDYLDVDIVEAGASQTELVVLKAIAGEIDMQVRDVPLRDLPLVKENEAAGDYTVKIWSRGDYAWPWIILYYDYPDEGIVELMFEQKFRQALSYAINRERINEIVTLGLANPRQAALSPESPEFQTREGKQVYNEWVNAYAAYEPDTAAGLLDDIGVVDTDGDGLRERPDGTPLELIVSVNSGDTQSIDAMDLVKEDWEAVGIKATIAPDEWSVFSQNVLAGEVMIRAWGSAAAWGLVSAPPVWAPVEGVTYCMGGARYGLYYQTGGAEGLAPPPGSFLEKLQDRFTDAVQTVDRAEREAKLLENYRVHIDDGPLYIGTVGEHPSPLVVKNNFRNVPDFGIVASWDLAFPGTANPEQFFIEQQ